MSSATIPISEPARRWLVALLLALSSSIDSAHAAEPVPTTDAQTEAARLFEEGIRAYDHGQLALAIEKLRAAYTAAPKPQVLYNLAQFQEAAGELVGSLESFEQYLVLSRDTLSPDREQAVRGKLVELRKRLSTLKIHTEPTTAAVLLDGASVTGLRVVAPGVHQLVASAQGFQPATLELHAEAGETLQVVLTLRPDQPTQPTVVRTKGAESSRPGRSRSLLADSKPNVNERSLSRIWAPTLIGTGIALGVGAVIAYAIQANQGRTWSSENRRLDAIDPAHRDDEYWQARADNVERSRSVRHLQGLEIGLFIGAAAVSSAGFGIWITSPSSRNKVASGVTYSNAW